MNGLSDSLTIGILLVLIFGAVSFYLYSRLSQNEKRVSLLENLLLTLKMNTEASLGGPDMVEAMGSPVQLSAEDIESVHEEDYAEMLKDINTTTPAPVMEKVEEAKSEEQDAEELLRSMGDNSVPAETNASRSMDVNYESMSVKELRALAKERGLTGIPQSKSAIIDLLKKNGGSPPSMITPLTEEELELGKTIEEL